MCVSLSVFYFVFIHLLVGAFYVLCCLCCVPLCVSVCVYALLQEVNPYSMVSSDPSELDRRYCVLKLQVPYSDLVHSPYTNSVLDSSTVNFWAPHSTLTLCSCLAAAPPFNMHVWLITIRNLHRRWDNGALALQTSYRSVFVHCKFFNIHYSFLDRLIH